MDPSKSYYRESGAGGFASADGTVEFYQRINALVRADMRVLDFGAGRGAWYFDDECSYRRQLRHLRGRVAKVVGCDIDDAILENQSVDSAVLLETPDRLPFDNQSFDLIIADYVLEHVEEPSAFAKEISRILKPGGWLCARTPNKYCYTALATRLIPNSLHVALLKCVQPDRKEIDVFPTTFRLNCFSDVERHFPSESFNNCTYRYEVEPTYHFGNKLVFMACLFLNWIVPPTMKSTLMIFVQRA